MRVLYLLFLVPLSALASCPAGIKLSNVPISTALPFCVKWESFSLGGCEVACPGVCVEMSGADSKGPIETTGGECKLGGGGDTGGDGGTGGGHNSSAVIGEYANPPRYVNSMLVGPNRETDFAPAVDSMLTELGMLKIGVGHLKKNTSTQINLLAGVEYDTSRIYDTLNQIQNHSIQLGYDLDSDLDSISSSLDAIVKNTSNGDPSTPGGDGSSSADTTAIKSMMQTAMGWWGGTPGNLSAINNNLTGISNSVAPLYPMLDYHNKQQTIYQGQMAGDLADIKKAIGNGQGSGGEGGADIDYSKMPGAAGDPLQVAGAEYESGLCQEGDNCAFDLERINKKYYESKEALKSAYKGIKTEVADIFKFQLSGSGSVPKCFEMYSLFGKTYSVCPSVGAYWETLAAIMMFVFYFVALMIVARR